MSNFRVTIYCLLLAGLMVHLPGCWWLGSQDDAPEVVFEPVENLLAEGASSEGPMSTAVAGIDRPLPPPDRPADQLLYRLRVYYVVERVSEDQRPEGLWSMVDEDQVPASQRQLLQRNGIRVGVGGELALARINQALSQRGAAVEVSRAPEAIGRPGLFLDIPLGRLHSDTMIMYTDRSGGMSGREFNQGTSVLRFQCLKPTEDERRLIEVRLGPYIVHGEQGERTRAGLAASMAGPRRPVFPFRDLETIVGLHYGQFVVVGLESGRNLTIGQHLFESKETPSRRITTVVLVPELTWLGEAPPEHLIYGERILRPEP